MAHSITITDNACKKASSLARSEGDGSILRIAVNGGGCSGFEYEYSMTNLLDDNDVLFEQNGAKIVIDKTSLALIDGSEIDFIENIAASKFVITNPKAKAKCGCGNSFTL